MGKIVAALDIGGTSIKSGLWNGSELLRTEEWDTNAKNGGTYVIKRAIEILRSYQPFDAIGISTAGQVDSSRGCIRYANENIPGYTGMEVRKILEEEFHVPVEVENERNAHIKDGVAVTKFIYWLKSQIGKTKITEISAAEQLEQFRNTQEHYVEPSFAPIIAYKEHGAIVHYSATKESDVELKPESFVLADTGGHYLEGTTDITRTIALGSLTQEEKEMYTTVLKGHIQLEMARFLQGCSGQSLDVLARTPLWEKGLDYNHGTGHGVGYLLSVHEGPNSFRYRPSVNGRNDCVFEEGMITSDEPGIYLEGKFGIRLENMIVCQKDMENDYGSFLCFDALTLVPFERSAIIAEELSTKEKEWLNKYHQKVFETIAPYLTEEEAGWLREETQEF